MSQVVKFCDRNPDRAVNFPSGYSLPEAKRDNGGDLKLLKVRGHELLEG